MSAQQPLQEIHDPTVLSPEPVRIATEDSLQSSIVYLRTLLKDLGLGADLNLLSADPKDVVATCNTIYGLMAQQQKLTGIQSQLRQELQRSRSQLSYAEKEMARAEARGAQRERELGSLTNKHQQSEESLRGDLRTARLESEEAAKKTIASERRVVQLQHEMRRKELEFERLQERLRTLLSDRRKQDKAALDMVGKLTLSKTGPTPPNSARSARSDEGLQAVVAAYEQKQAATQGELEQLQHAFMALQEEYKTLVNANARRADAQLAEAAASEIFLTPMDHLRLDELYAEASRRNLLLEQRIKSYNGWDEASEQVLPLWRSVMVDQSALLSQTLAAIKSSHRALEAQHQADMRRVMAQYQEQLTAGKRGWEEEHATQEAAAREELVRVQQALSEQVAQLTGTLSEHEETFRSERERLQAELDKARRALESSSDELQQVKEEIQLRDAALENARAALEAGEQGLREAVSAREQLLGLLQEKEAQMAAVQADHSGLLVELEGKETAAQQRCQSLEEELASMKLDLAAAVERAEQTSKALEEQERMLQETENASNAELGAAKPEHDQLLAQATEEAASLREELVLLQARLAENERETQEKTLETETTCANLASKLELARAETAGLHSKLAAAEAEITRLQEEASAATHQAKARQESQAIAEHRAQAATMLASLQAKRTDFEALQSEYKTLMRKYLPGLGAGPLLERALARKVQSAAQEIGALGVEPIYGQ